MVLTPRQNTEGKDIAEGKMRSFAADFAVVDETESSRSVPIGMNFPWTAVFRHRQKGKRASTMTEEEEMPWMWDYYKEQGNLTALAEQRIEHILVVLDF